MNRLPSLVLFDLDGVLVRYDRTVRLAHLGAALGRTPGDVRRALFDSGLEDRFDAGELDAEAYLAQLGAALATRVTVETWAQARGAAMRLDPVLPARLAALARRCTLAVLTNNGGLLLDVLPRLLPALAAPFDGRLLCSGRLGVRKPDPRVFDRALAQLGHAPGATLFLDDAPANVDGARRAGVQALHVPGPDALPGVLAAAGLA